MTKEEKKGPMFQLFQGSSLDGYIEKARTGGGLDEFIQIAKPKEEHKAPEGFEFEFPFGSAPKTEETKIPEPTELESDTDAVFEMEDWEIRDLDCEGLKDILNEIEFFTPKLADLGFHGAIAAQIVPVRGSNVVVNIHDALDFLNRTRADVELYIRQRCATAKAVDWSAPKTEETIRSRKLVKLTRDTNLEAYGVKMRAMSSGFAGHVHSLPAQVANRLIAEGRAVEYKEEPKRYVNLTTPEGEKKVLTWSQYLRYLKGGT